MSCVFLKSRLFLLDSLLLATSVFLSCAFYVSDFTVPHLLPIYIFFLVVCFDAKINFDDNAEFRQKAVFAMDDMSESDPTETEAAKWNLKYIGMDGNIACFGMDTKPCNKSLSPERTYTNN